MTAKSRTEGLLFDLDGVFHVDEALIPGALECLREVRRLHLPFRFITNTTTRTGPQVGEKLRAIGIDVRDDDIFSAIDATVGWLRQRNARSLMLAVHDNVREAFLEFEPGTEASIPDHVVIGDIGKAWRYELLDELFDTLMQGAELVAMHRNRYWRTGKSLHLDIGAFVAGLEYATGKQATIIGKPNRSFFEMAAGAMRLRPEQVAVIGDDIESDIGGALRAGMLGVLVRTGKYHSASVAQSAVVPDEVLASVADVPEWLARRGA